MVDYSATMRHLESKNLHFFTYHPKSLKPIKTVIHHLPSDSPAEDIRPTIELVTLGFKIISVRQMTTSKPQPSGGSQTTDLPLFLVTLVPTRSHQIRVLFGRFVDGGGGAVRRCYAKRAVTVMPSCSGGVT
jgi:hypothetical protein